MEYDGTLRLAFDPFRLLALSLAGWLNQCQQEAIDYLEEVCLSGCFRKADAGIGSARQGRRL